MQSDTPQGKNISRSGRVITPTQQYQDYLSSTSPKTPRSKAKNSSNESEDLCEDQDDSFEEISAVASNDFDLRNDMAGNVIYKFNTPKKSDGMKRKAENTPKTPATALSRLSLNSPKTPRTLTASFQKQTFATPAGVRNRNKKALLKAQLPQDDSESESSADEHSDYEAAESTDDTSNDDNDNDDDDDDFEDTKPVASKRTAIAKPKAVEVPTKTRPTRGRPKKNANAEDFIPDSDNYFLTAANKKVKTRKNQIDSQMVRFMCIVLFSLSE